MNSKSSIARKCLSGWNVLSVALLSTLLSACDKTVDNDNAPGKPSAVITYPANGDTLYDAATIEFEASDDKGIVSVELYLDNELYDRSVTPPFLLKPIVAPGYLPNVSYAIWVKVSDNDGNTETSGVVNFLMRNLSARDLRLVQFNDSSALLRWVDVSSAETGFEVEQSTDSVSFFHIASAGRDVDSCRVNHVFLQSQPYYFRIKSKSSDGRERFSNIVSGLNPLRPITDLTVDGYYSEYVRLSWKDNSNSEIMFHLYESTNDSDFYLIDAVSANETTFQSAHNREQLNSYSYALRAISSRDSTGLSLPAKAWGNGSFESGRIEYPWRGNPSGEYGWKIDWGYGARWGRYRVRASPRWDMCSRLFYPTQFTGERTITFLYFGSPSSSTNSFTFFVNDSAVQLYVDYQIRVFSQAFDLPAQSELSWQVCGCEGAIDNVEIR